MLEYDYFNFLNKYRRKELLRYLSCISFLPDNSSHVYKICTLIYNELLKKSGIKHFYIPSFRRDIRKYYPMESLEDPQENLFVDCVHTPQGTFRVFPGIFSDLQHNLTRLLEVAEYNKIPQKRLGITYALLELSDNIAERLGLNRYDVGSALSHEIAFSNKDTVLCIYQNIKITSSEIRYLCGKYHLHCADIKHLLYHSNRQAVAQFLRDMQGFSIVECSPFILYHPGEYIPLYPSAILCAAYIECLKTIRGVIGYDELYSNYKETLITDVVRSINDGKRSLFDRIDNSGNTFLVFWYDADKLALICIDLLGTDADFLSVHNKIKSKFPKFSIVDVYLQNSLELNDSFLSCKSDLIMPVDDFIVMMGQKEMNLQELYYYIEEKKKINQTSIIQELDAFAYYMSNKHTLYFDDNPNYVLFSIGTAFDMKAKYYAYTDSHVILANGHPIMLRHYEDLSVGIPIYIPRAADIKTNNVYIGELFGNVISFQIDNRNDNELLLCAEIAKSLILWMYAIVRKDFDMSIINGLTVFLTLSEGTDLQLRKAEVSIYFLHIPKSLFCDTATRPEKIILKTLVDGLLQEKKADYTAFNDTLDVVFRECIGSALLIQPEGLEYWESNDGHTSCYYINDNACDIVLEEIANYINRKGQEEWLTIEESASLVPDLITYIEKEINSLLASLACEDFIISLFELHHGMLFWLVTTQNRFDKVNSLLNYLGGSYDEQRMLMNKYSETNNFTMNLIERIVLDNMQGDKMTFTIEKIDRLYALMHLLYTLGIYCDILRSNKSDEMRIKILTNGRIVLPHKYFDDIQKYLLDSRKLEFYNQNTLLELHSIVPSPKIEIDSPLFLDTFSAEFKIDFNEYRKVLQLSVKYSLNHDMPIVCMQEDEFDRLILKDAMKNEHIELFKKKFFLSVIDKNEVKSYELYLQRFNREYQLSSRPWVFYNGKVFYSVKSIHHHEKIMMDRIISGRIKAESKEMRAFKGRINANKGKVFNNAIYCLFNNLKDGNLYVDKEVTICPDGRLKSKINLGDIDILLVNKSLRKIICIEAKKYADSRTVYEMMTEKNETIDDMKDVSRRNDWLKSHLECFKSLCKDVDDNFEMETVVVTFNLSSYAYLTNQNNLCFRFIPAVKLLENPMDIFILAYLRK